MNLLDRFTTQVGDMVVEAAPINLKGVAAVSLWKRKPLPPAFGTVTGSFWEVAP
jgi:hypothetical protein